MLVQINEIKVNPGRREADPEGVQELVDSISKVGLINPIMIDQEHILIAGLHRLEAAKLLGWSEIECTVSSLEGLLAELAEVDENVVRRDLPAVEFSDLLLRRKEIYEALHPEARHGGDRKSEKIKTQNFRFDSTKSFVQDTADKLKVSPRTVELQVQTAKNLTPEAKDIIRNSGKKITKQSALKLSRLAPDQQKDAANKLAAGDIRSMDEYHPAPSPAEPNSPKKQLPQESYPQKASVPPAAPASPALETGYYPTIKDSVADLKNPDKDRSLTPAIFLVTFTLFLQRFSQSVKSYAVNESAAVFPALTQEHLTQIQQEINSVHKALDELFLIMEKESKQ